MRDSPQNELNQSEPSVGLSFLQWFRDQVNERGLPDALRGCFSIGWQFLQDSLPERRRHRYGDVDYDWDHRVDTTSATVGWRARLLGLLHSPYQPTDPVLFHEMLEALKINFAEFVFIDLGSGKGRALLMAADYPFRRIVGVELLADLHCIAVKNISKYKSDSQRCFAIEPICGDAGNFHFPEEPTVLYLFNPLPEPGLIRLLENLERSLTQRPRPVFVIYHNPLLEHVLAGRAWLRKIGGTHQYAVFTFNSRGEGLDCHG
jgi:SAM-dependent methyltransferase